MSVMSDIEQRLADGGTILLDGGMGTELQARGVPMYDKAWSARANLDHLDIVEQVHDDYVRAGADVIIANTFAAGPLPLEAAGLADRGQEINRRAVEAARRARDRAADRPVAVAGSISGMGTENVSRIEQADASRLLDGYREQAAVLVDAGVDLLAAEMIQSPQWHGLAVEAAVETGLPVWLGICAGARDGVGNLPTFSYPELGFEEALIALLREQPVAAVAVMHTELDDVDAALDIVFRHWDGPVGAYPHHGDYRPPTWVFKPLAPETFAARATRWVDRGVQIVGGCCGTRPEHIRRLCEELKARGTERLA